MEHTYVHGEVEVKKTGRTAEKPGMAGKKMVLAEITPVSEFDGTWKKWINPQALFEINQEESK